MTAHPCGCFWLLAAPESLAVTVVSPSLQSLLSHRFGLAPNAVLGRCLVDLFASVAPAPASALAATAAEPGSTASAATASTADAAAAAAASRRRLAAGAQPTAYNTAYNTAYHPASHSASHSAAAWSESAAALTSDLGRFRSIASRPLQSSVFRWKLRPFSNAPADSESSSSLHSLPDVDVIVTHGGSFLLVLVHMADACSDGPVEDSRFMQDALDALAASPTGPRGPAAAPTAIQVLRTSDCSLLAAFPQHFAASTLGFDIAALHDRPSYFGFVLPRVELDLFYAVMDRHAPASVQPQAQARTAQERLAHAYHSQPHPQPRDANSDMARTAAYKSFSISHSFKAANADLHAASAVRHLPVKSLVLFFHSLLFVLTEECPIDASVSPTAPLAHAPSPVGHPTYNHQQHAHTYNEQQQQQQSYHSSQLKQQQQQQQSLGPPLIPPTRYNPPPSSSSLPLTAAAARPSMPPRLSPVAPVSQTPESNLPFPLGPPNESASSEKSSFAGPPSERSSTPSSVKPQPLSMLLSAKFANGSFGSRGDMRSPSGFLHLDQQPRHTDHQNATVGQVERPMYTNAPGSSDLASASASAAASSSSSSYSAPRDSSANVQPPSTVPSNRSSGTLAPSSLQNLLALSSSKSYMAAPPRFPALTHDAPSTASVYNHYADTNRGKHPAPLLSLPQSRQTGDVRSTPSPSISGSVALTSALDSSLSGKDTLAPLRHLTPPSSGTVPSSTPANVQFGRLTAAAKQDSISMPMDRGMLLPPPSAMRFEESSMEPFPKDTSGQLPRIDPNRKPHATTLKEHAVSSSASKGSGVWPLASWSSGSSSKGPMFRPSLPSNTGTAMNPSWNGSAPALKVSTVSIPGISKMFDTLGKPSTAKLPDLRGSGDAHRTMSEDVGHAPSSSSSSLVHPRSYGYQDNTHADQPSQEKALQHRDLYNLGHSGQIHKRQRMDVDTRGARMPERVSVSPPLPLDGHYRRAAQPLVGSEATRSHPLTTSSSSSASSSRLPSPRYDPSMQLQKPHLRSPPLAPFAYGQHTEQHSQPPPPPTRSPDHYQQHQQQPHQKIPLKRQAPDANATAYDQTVSREPGFPPHQSHFGQQSSQGAHSKVHPGQSHHQTYQPQHAPQPYPHQIQRQDRSNLPAPFPSDTDIHNSFADGFSGQPDDGHGLALLRGYPPPRPLGMRRSKAPPVVRQCENCNTSDSPEWRRGPSGHKTLCNACGLRYARIIAKRRDAHRKNTGGNEQVLLPAPPVSQVMSFEASQRHLGLTVNGMANGTERLDTAMDPSPTGQFHQADQHPQHSHIDAQPRQPQQPPHQQYYPPQSSTSGYQ